MKFACQQANFILEQWEDQELYRIETFLDTLTEDELNTFVGGEDTEVQLLANRSANARLANQLLNEFFENPAST